MEIHNPFKVWFDSNKTRHQKFRRRLKWQMPLLALAGVALYLPIYTKAPVALILLGEGLFLGYSVSLLVHINQHRTRAEVEGEVLAVLIELQEKYEAAKGEREDENGEG